MGRESSHGLFYLPLLVLKARHLSGSAFCTGFSRLEVPEQALDGIPLGLRSVVKINHKPEVLWILYGGRRFFYSRRLLLGALAINK